MMAPIPSAAGSAGGRAQAWAQGSGRKLEAGIREFQRQLEGLRAEGREWLRLGRRFLRQVQEPGGRQRQILPLLTVAAGAGWLAGFLTGRRREG